jgi:hypothetical protein
MGCYLVPQKIPHGIVKGGKRALKCKEERSSSQSVCEHFCNTACCILAVLVPPLKPPRWFWGRVFQYRRIPQRRPLICTFIIFVEQIAKVLNSNVQVAKLVKVRRGVPLNINSTQNAASEMLSARNCKDELNNSTVFSFFQKAVWDTCKYIPSVGGNMAILPSSCCVCFFAH